VRLFLAVFPPPEAQALAHDLIEQLRAPRDGVSWVRRENLHVTLRFLGDVDADEATRAEDAAREAAKGAAPFGALLGPPGAFPSAKKARVLWLGLLEGVEPMTRLANALEAALVARGFESEGRDYTPHLTLARVKEPGADWTSRLVAAPSLRDEPGARFTVTRIDVVESDLGPGGARYRVRTSAELAK